MIERTLFLFVFILILLLICFAALISIIEECDNELTRRDKKLSLTAGRRHKKNEEVKKDL